MTDWATEELDALQTSLRKLGGHGFPNWADDADKAITALRSREAMIEAAAIERAAKTVEWKYNDASVVNGVDVMTWAHEEIRALITPGARTMLDQRIAEAEQVGYERGLREAGGDAR